MAGVLKSRRRRKQPRETKPPQSALFALPLFCAHLLRVHLGGTLAALGQLGLRRDHAPVCAVVVVVVVGEEVKPWGDRTGTCCTMNALLAPCITTPCLPTKQIAPASATLAAAARRGGRPARGSAGLMCFFGGRRRERWWWWAAMLQHILPTAQHLDQHPPRSPTAHNLYIYTSASLPEQPRPRAAGCLPSAACFRWCRCCFVLLLCAVRAPFVWINLRLCAYASIRSRLAATRDECGFNQKRGKRKSREGCARVFCLRRRRGAARRFVAGVTRACGGFDGAGASLRKHYAGPSPSPTLLHLEVFRSPVGI